MVTIEQIFTTTSSNVACVPPQDASYLAAYDHEEADTSMILYLADAINKSFKKGLLCTVDTNVVALAVAATKYVCTRIVDSI